MNTYRMKVIKLNKLPFGVKKWKLIGDEYPLYGF